MTPAHPDCRRAPCGILVAATLLALAGGCTSQLFRKPAPPISLAPPPGVAAPAASLPPPPALSPLPSFADVDARQLQSTLARSQDENQLLKDEIAVLREQLASTSGQLAATRPPGAGATAPPFDMPGHNAFAGPVTPGQPSPPRQPSGLPAGLKSAAAGAAPAATVGPAAMHAAAGQLAVAGVETRFDGHVVRLELPAERLFDDGSASLLPGGTALLTQVAGEIDRVFPGHFLGIEGHVDTEPLQQAAWGSRHQLTAARAAAVFDFFTTRTPLREGQLFLVAHGANHPVVSNATATGRLRNRRMELVIYPERMGAADEPSPEPR